MSPDRSASKCVLVLGVGPVAADNPPRLHAPGLRLWTLASFLASRGYEVVVGMVGFGGAGHATASPGAAGEGHAPTPDSLPHGIVRYRLPYSLEEAAEQVRAIDLRHRPRCVVSTTDFMNLVAVGAALPVPLWLDFMGQPMTERQLLADVYGSDEGLIGQWQYVAPSLLAGDRFSVCSHNQRYMMLGELGAVGRLNRHTAQCDLVEVLVPFHLGETRFRHTRAVLRGVRLRQDDFVVLWSGGYNTWTDVDTLFTGLERGMAQHARIVFVSTGGAIPGHDDRTFERFRQMVEKSPDRARFELCGWVPTEDVPNYYLESNIALNVDRWSVEGQVGYRTRILDWIMAGLPVVTTVLSELTKDLAQRNYLTTFRIGDPQDLGIKLAALAVDCSTAIERTAKAREYLLKTLSPDVVLAPLAAWVENPQPAPDLPPPRERPELGAWGPDNSLARNHRVLVASAAKTKGFLARLVQRLS